MSYYKAFKKTQLNEFFNHKITNVKGKIPTSINGALYRNTSVHIVRDGKSLSHWFDGDGAILKIAIKNGEAYASYKYVQTESLKIENKLNKYIFPTIGDIPTNFIDKWKVTFQPANKANTSVLPLENKLLALWEGGLPYALDLETLETKGLDNLNGIKSGAYTAHPKVDPDTGEVYNVGVVQGKKGMNVYKSNKNGDIVKSTYVESYKYQSTLIHDMCIAGEYIVYIAFPTNIDLFSLLLRKKTFNEIISWDYTGYNEIIILDKKDLNLVKRIKVDPFFFYHYSNGFVDEMGNLIIDLVKHTGMEMFTVFPSLITKGELDKCYMNGKLVRMTIDINNGKLLNEMVLFDKNCEFPVIKDNTVGKKNDTIIFNYDNTNRDYFKNIAKLDLTNNKIIDREFDDHQYSSEVLHIDGNENDYLISTFFDGQNESSYVKIMDNNLSDIATFDLPEMVHFSFHGRWVNNKI
jgi:all-trans-8'-apo-beta-carotenal 15,15'-oxygenase